MRGKKTAQTNFIALVNVENRIPKDHPIREIKAIAEEVFRRLGEHFEDLYDEHGRPSIPPERLLGAKLLIALYSIRSERQFCERPQYDLLFQWFLDINPDEPQALFDASSFSKNQQRLLQESTPDAFFACVVEAAKERGLLSDEHFSVDGTMIEAWASLKSFRRKDDPQGPGAGNAWMDFRGESRRNATHQSTSDPEAKLLRKGPGQAAKLCFMAHAAMENRHGFCVHLKVTPSVGVTEGQAALEQIGELVERGFRPQTVGADKGYHSREFVQGCRELGVSPHVAQIEGRQVEGLDARTTGQRGYVTSQRIRKRIEEIFGWMKATGGLRKTRYRGVERTHGSAQMVASAYNLLRMAKLSLRAALSPPRAVGA